jgi:hypothetical protein
MTTTINITWHQPDERSEGREDSAWYIYQSAHDAVCTVSNGDREITIYADGEMRVIVYGEEIVRYCEQFREYGMKADTDLITAHENGHIEWANNPWFDLYTNDRNVGEDGWLNCVCDTLSDAIEQATALLSEDELWGDEE